MDMQSEFENNLGFLDGIDNNNNIDRRDAPNGIDNNNNIGRWDAPNGMCRPNPAMPPSSPGTLNPGNGFSLAMAYVPYQDFSDYFTSYADALDNGSLFKNLVKTFSGNRGGRK